MAMTVSHVSSAAAFYTTGIFCGILLTGIGVERCSSRLAGPPKNIFNGTIVTQPQASCWRPWGSSRAAPESVQEPKIYQFPPEQPACPTCLDVQSSTADWVVLACGHVYHGICIDQQITALGPNTSYPCPECRSPFSDALVADPLLKSLLTDVGSDFSTFLHGSAQQQMWPFYVRVEKSKNWEVCLGSWDLLMVLEKINHLNQHAFSEETWASLIGSARSVVSLLQARPQLTDAIVSICAGTDDVTPALRAIEQISRIKRSVTRSYDVDKRHLAFFEVEPMRRGIGIAFCTEDVRFNHLAWRAITLQAGITRRTEIVPIMGAGSSIQEQPQTTL